MAQGVTRFVGIAVGAALLVAGCTPDEGPTGQPVTTSPTAPPSTAQPSTAQPSTSEPSVAVPEPSSTAPVTVTSAPSRLPTATTTQVTRPTVPAESDGPTATATGTGSDGVPAGTADFNQPFAFPSGLTVTIARPVRFTPSPQVQVTEPMTYSWVLVTLRNATSSSIDTGLIGHDASAGGAEAPRVYDPANDIPAPGQNPGALAPGQVRSYRVAFAHQPGQSLAVRTAYGWDGQVIHT